MQSIRIKINNCEVEICNLGKVKDYFTFEANNANLTKTENDAFYIAASITDRAEFYPSLVCDLLKLDTFDFEELFNACSQFQQQNGVPYFINPNTIKLVHGLEIDGISFDLVEFGETSLIQNQNEAEKQGLSGARLNAYVIGKEIVKLSQSNGAAIFEGQLSLKQFGEMTLTDGVGLVDLYKQRKHFIALARQAAKDSTSFQKIPLSDNIQPKKEVIH